MPRSTLKQRGATHVFPKDFLPLMHELLETHAGLEFLRGTKEFQARYAETVIARIFYRLDRRHLGRLSLRDLQKSTLVEAMQLVHSDVSVATGTLLHPLLRSKSRLCRLCLLVFLSFHPV